MRVNSPWSQNIQFFESLPSTNDLLLEMAESGAPEGTIVIAEEQTRGRGQFHRPWTSPSGMGLWMSLLLRLPIENEIIKGLSQLGPVSLSNALLELGIDPSLLKIKAPNDLLLQGKKVAGILVETRRGISSFAVIGLGLNIHQRAKDFPSELREKATSLTLAGIDHINREQLLPVVIACLYKHYQELRSDPLALHDAWNAFEVGLD
jgi:BirA family biotin operon repressor/biotin-[acetyl-CoA-carboxylase] ligase